MKLSPIVCAGALVCALLLPGRAAPSQESRPNPAAAGATDPSAALRDILVAACSQSQDDFSRFLTARNKESFGRMSATARLAFMKRFVLLNESGKPSVTTDVSGRAIVRCETPAGAAEIQIGGADIQDNVVFFPVTLRDASDSTGAGAIRVNMGLVRENGQWKILSLGLVLLDLPSLEVEWDSEEAGKNEASAIQSLKEIAAAVESYRHKYLRLPDLLSSLGPAVNGPASPLSAGLVEAGLASGRKNGYSFRYVIAGASTLGAPAKFELSATPLTYARTGRRSFFLDSNGVLRAADHAGAIGSVSDPQLSEP